MASGRAFVLELLVVAVIGQLLFAESSRVTNSTKSTLMTEHTGFTASLIHRDNYFTDEVEGLTRREKRERDARRSRQRVQSFMNRRRLSGIPTQATDDGTSRWEADLSDIAWAAEGSYLMELSLGTPAQTFMAIADTGSDLTWLECGPNCQKCAREQCQPCSNGDFFRPSDSSTYDGQQCSTTACEFLSGSCESSGCEYGYYYGDGSVTEGTLAQDTITMQKVEGGTQAVTDFFFGCSSYTDSNTSWLYVARGLVGLGRGTVSFPSQLGSNFGQKFGYCLVNSEISETWAYSSPLYFGSDAVPANVSNLQSTPINTADSLTYYAVTCTAISVNGEKVSSTGGNFIFDSGTTYTLLTEDIFYYLSNAIQEQITDYTIADTEDSIDGGLCYYASWTEWESGNGVPSISFQFANTSGFNLQVYTAWLIYENDGSDMVCLAMLPIQSDFSIFGGFQQVDSHILYDLENDVVGFTQSTPCLATNTGMLLPPPAPPLPPTNSAGASISSGLLTPLLLLLFVFVQL